MNMEVMILVWSLIGLLISIVGWILSLLIERNANVLGILTIIIGLISFIPARYAIHAELPISLITCGLAGLIFVITGIIGIAVKGKSAPE